VQHLVAAAVREAHASNATSPVDVAELAAPGSSTTSGSSSSTSVILSSARVAERNVSVELRELLHRVEEVLDVER
jgi:hypothetical protein